MFHWICPECGREIPPAVKECASCDPSSVPASTAPEAPPPPPPAPRPDPLFRLAQKLRDAQRPLAKAAQPAPSPELSQAPPQALSPALSIDEAPAPPPAPPEPLRSDPSPQMLLLESASGSVALLAPPE